MNNNPMSDALLLKIGSALELISIELHTANQLSAMSLQHVHMPAHIQEEAQRVLESAAEKAKAIEAQNKSTLDQIAAALGEEEQKDA